MISLVVPVVHNHHNLQKLLMSVLLQVCHDNIRVLLIFNKRKLISNYEKIISLFSKKINITYLVCNEGDLRQYGLKMCTTKYVMFLKGNDFFYDAFSVDTLLRNLDSNSDYKFIYGNYVEYHGEYEYADIDNVFLSMNGKIFDVKFLKENNVMLKSNGDFDVDTVSSCFMLTDNYLHIEGVVCVNNSFEYDILKNMRFLVNAIIDNYNLYVDKVDSNVLNNYVFKNFNYLNNIFINNVALISYSEFQKIISPLELLYRSILKGV